MPAAPSDPESHAQGAAEQARELIAALKAGDETAFTRMVDAHHGSLVRLASQYVSGAAIAEEVAQEAWIAFLGSLDRFEGRSGLKTWLFRIVLNCARARRRSEGRSVPFSSLGEEGDDSQPAVDESRFAQEGPWAGHWSKPPRAFEDAERRLLGAELLEQMQSAIETLPRAQREVILLRDVEGLCADEVCDLLQLSEANQRVLLHRARARIRSGIEAYVEREGGAS